MSKGSSIAGTGDAIAMPVSLTAIAIAVIPSGRRRPMRPGKGTPPGGR